MSSYDDEDEDAVAVVEPFTDSVDVDDPTEIPDLNDFTFSDDPEFTDEDKAAGE